MNRNRNRDDYRRRHRERNFSDYNYGNSNYQGYENRDRSRNRYGSSWRNDERREDVTQDGRNFGDRYDRNERFSNGPYRNEAYSAELDWNTSDYRGRNHRSFPYDDRHRDDLGRRSVQNDNWNSWASFNDSSYGRRSNRDYDSEDRWNDDDDRDDNYGVSDYGIRYSGTGSYSAFGVPRIRYSEDRMRGQNASYYQDRSYGDEDVGIGERVRRFFGLAPKGYSRSDDRIYEDVCERLSQDGRFDPSDIEVKVENGVVTLEGNIDSRQAKWLAEDCIDNVFGVKDINNHLHVKREGTSSTLQQQSGKSNTDRSNVSGATKIKSARA